MSYHYEIWADVVGSFLTVTLPTASVPQLSLPWAQLFFFVTEATLFFLSRAQLIFL
jgi:hypothetical protein